VTKTSMQILYCLYKIIEKIILDGRIRFSLDQELDKFKKANNLLEEEW